MNLIQKKRDNKILIFLIIFYYPSKFDLISTIVTKLLYDFSITKIFIFIIY